ncbi:MAG: GNAT family N-acetyltransferase [Steroidobacteraceae bacterium]
MSPAITVTQLDAVRDLIRAFVEWQRVRNGADLHLVEKYFDAAAVDAELASLPGKYGPPSGGLLLATVDGVPAGCVALHALDDGSCEMKRMFVQPAFQGRGVGAALVTGIVERARQIGYRLMRLDTSYRQIEAQRLYARHGFRTVAPYYELPVDLRGWLVFMERDLAVGAEMNDHPASSP